MFRLFAFLAPAVLFYVYVVTILARYGTWWSVHLTAGVPVITGIVGLLVSYVTLPPGREDASRA